MKDDGELLCKSKNLHAINFSAELVPPARDGHLASHMGCWHRAGRIILQHSTALVIANVPERQLAECPIFSEYENLIQLAHGIGLRVTIASIFSGKSTPYFRLPAPFNSLTISVQTWTIVNWHTLYDGAKNLVRLKLSTSAHSHNWL